jgi:hypothetical protein
MALHIAKLECEHASAHLKGRALHILQSLVFSAIALEAFTNAACARFHDSTGWKAFERKPTLTKLEWLCGKITLPYDTLLGPWCTAVWLVDFRNRVVHAKPQNVENEEFFSQESFDERRIQPPESDLEKDFTLANAQCAVAAIEQAIDLVRKVFPEDLSLGLFVDSWSGTTTLVESQL